ncbi:transcriptional regulator [Bradyrhizobium japonicum]|uniref:Transcriptional regulator n=1 Tax=Bradyrhizobium japonicum TaxID=375 RepID=A0A0A3XJ76_BRAJP|nr:LysR family transcriptional regulator [Bradyrhizobium japonicum]KGT73216.1 transcriptional regulator [Bradyrhizobium japonicum]
MDLSVRQLRYVSEVAKLGSMQAASRSLRISQSSILAAIELAEAEMGARIFERRPSRGMSLTPAGEQFISAARSMLSAEAEFKRTIGSLGLNPPAIRIGCFNPFGTLFIPDTLRRYIERCGPAEVSVLEGDQVQLREWLASGLVDVVVTYDIGPHFKENTTRVCKMPAHALLSRSDPLANQSVVSIAELATRPLVLLDLPQTAPYLLTLFDVLAAQPKIGLRTRNYDTIRTSVACGFGASVLNMPPLGHACPDGAALIRLPISDDLPAPTVVIADVYGSNKPEYVRLLIEVICGFFRDLGPRNFAIATPKQELTLFDV